MHSFSNYLRTSDEHDLSYEVEYLLGGKSGEVENLSLVLTELVAFREGIRLIEYLGDTNKRQEAEAIAYTVSGGNVILGKVLSTGVLAIWALNEAVEDVRALLAGKQVPLLVLAGKELLHQDYTEHLQWLLYMVPKDELLERGLSLVQSTMRMEREDFLLENSVVAAKATVYGTQKSLFTKIYFRENFTVHTSYAYLMEERRE